jgi:hypothetical protein
MHNLLLIISYVRDCSEQCCKHPDRTYKSRAFRFRSRIVISFFLARCSCVIRHPGIVCLIIGLIKCIQQLIKSSISSGLVALQSSVNVNLPCKNPVTLKCSGSISLVPELCIDSKINTLIH